MKFQMNFNVVPLHIAIMNENIETVKLLLSHPDIDVNIPMIKIIIYSLHFHFYSLIPFINTFL